MSDERIHNLPSGRAPPRANPQESEFFQLAGVTAGDVLNPIWRSRRENIREAFGPDGYPVYLEGGFPHHFEFCSTNLSKPRQLWRRLRFCLWERFGILRYGNTPVVVTYGANLTRLVGVLLRRRRDVKLIVEVPGVPNRKEVIADPDPTLQLELVGWKLDRDEPKRLAAGHPRIECLGAAKHDKAPLEDPELAARVAANAYDHMHAELDEAAFVRRFDELLDAVLPDRREEAAASPGGGG
jgi:hypothetical protein